MTTWEIGEFTPASSSYRDLGEDTGDFLDPIEVPDLTS
jgi:hypothetical protein